MPILDDIRTLEEAVAVQIGSVSVARASDAALAEAVVDAVLAILDDGQVSLADLADDELLQLVARVLAELFPDWTAELAQLVTDRLASAIDLTETFYVAQGVDVGGLRQAARRAALARQLAESLQSGFGTLQTRLAQATVDAIREQLLAGEIDRAALASTIETQTGTSTRFARTQAQAAVGGLNQTYREQVAQSAGLTFYSYYGTVQNNTRPFCRIHVGYVFPRARVEQMRNGMLEPVIVFKGGWQCRHSWLGVDPSWDPDLAARVVDVEPTVVALDAAGNRKITIVAPAGRLDRLKAQIPLQTRGYLRFYDAETSDTGFVAVHEDWHAERLGARAGSARRGEFDRERDVGLALAEHGHRIQLDTNAQTNFGGPADLLVDGVVGEVKTVTEALSATGLRDRIRRNRRKESGAVQYQSAIYVFDLAVEPDPSLLADATRELAAWVRRSPERKAFIVHSYSDAHVDIIHG